MASPIFSFSNSSQYFNDNPIVGIAAVSLLLESIILLLILNPTLSSLWFVFPHGLVVLSLIFFLKNYEQTEKDTYFLILLTLSTAVLSALGAVFVILLFMFLQRANNFQRDTPPNSYESILSEVKKPEQEDLFEKLVSGKVESLGHSSVIPFMDVLHFGTQRQKQTLVALLINNYQKDFSPVLKEAIKDKDNSIRVLASMGVAQIENQFMKRTIEIETTRGESDRATKNYFKTLGRHYDDYAHCEILEEFMQMDFRNLAIQAYKDHLRVTPLDGEVLFWLGRALLRNKKWSESAIVFEVALKNNLLAPENMVWYLECLYRIKQYQKLGNAAFNYYSHAKKTKAGIPTQLNGVLEAWILSPG